MATMVEKDVSACVMEVSSHALQLGRVKEVDFNVAVRTSCFIFLVLFGTYELQICWDMR